MIVINPKPRETRFRVLNFFYLYNKLTVSLILPPYILNKALYLNETWKLKKANNLLI